MQTTADSSAPVATQPGSLSRKSLWTGRIFSGLITAFLIFDAVIHLMKPAPVVEAFAKLGFPLRLAVPLGIIELVRIVLYGLPSTSILDAILLKGYFVGAIAIQLLTPNALLVEVLFTSSDGVMSCVRIS